MKESKKVDEKKRKNLAMKEREKERKSYNNKRK